MLRAWQNDSTFGKHDHVSNVVGTMFPHFSGAVACAGVYLYVALVFNTITKTLTAAPDNNLRSRKKTHTGTNIHTD